jgi:nitroreductase
MRRSRCTRSTGSAFSCEARGFLRWVLDATERGERPRVLYDIDGNVPPREREDFGYSGYRRSVPVRWGNAAADQIQHDGEILDCAYQWSKYHGSIDSRLWARSRNLIMAAANECGNPDHGIVLNEGLGAAFVGAFDDDEVRTVLGLPRAVRPIGLISIGFCAEAPTKVPRPPKERIIHYERWQGR